MKKRVFILIAIFIINSILLSGCSNYRELDKLTLIAGLTIDKNEQGKYLVTVETVDLNEGGRDTKIKSKLIDSYGDTVVDAVRNLLNIVSPKPYWGQLQLVIISQEVAKEGIVKILDTLVRYTEVRLNIDIIVSKGKTAKEIFDSQILTTEIRSYEIKKMLGEQMRYLSKTYRVKAYEIINYLSGEGISSVMPAIRVTENQGEKTAELSGSAVFKRDKLVGFLNGDETKSLLFIRDKIRGGVLSVKEPPRSGHANVTLGIEGSKTKLKPAYSNGKVTINIQINTKVTMLENGTNKSFMDENKRSVLKHDTEEMLKANIKNVIRKVQEDYGADVFGFGNTIYRDMPSLWKEIKPGWKDIFKSLDVNVSINIDIRNLGLLDKPIKVGD